MKSIKIYMSLLAALAFSFSNAQSLEDVIVETYYVSDANDATDTDGGSLPEGSVTYRIYLDLGPDTRVETVFGSVNHELKIETTTLFFNNEDRGEISGDAIGNNRLDENTVALDSYITIGAASDENLGVLKTDDNDGSIVGGENNDGGSEGIEGGLLTNDDPMAGVPLTTADGLIEGAVPSITLVAEDEDIFDVFADENAGPLFSTTNGAWAVLGGFEGQTDENRVLIAQVTTDGELSFMLNVRVNNVDGGNPIDYVAMNPQDGEIMFPALTFPQAAVPGCMDMTACNFNPDATEDDDSCVFADDACEFCNEDGTVGETVVVGGTLTYDDGSETQTQCAGDDVDYNVSLTGNEGPASAYVVTTSVNDGVIVLGIQTENPFNFAPAPPGACLIWHLSYDPDNSNVADVVIGETSALDLTGCFDLSNSIEIIREDCPPVLGCTDMTACNFNPDATEDDGSCLIPDDCFECDGESLVPVAFPAVEVSSITTTFTGNGYDLAWTPVLGQIGCQLQGREVNGAPLGGRQIFGEDAGSFFLWGSVLEFNTEYEWRVRCGCSADPLNVGPWSPWQPFTTPSGVSIQSSPNPTNGISNVSFSVLSEGNVTLEVYDMSGRMVDAIFNGVAAANTDYRFEFDGTSLVNGVYLYRLTTENEVVIDKFMIAK
jgi:hypothetical protein